MNPNVYEDISPHPNCYSHNRRLTNYHSCDEEYNNIDPWEMEERRQRFVSTASDRELADRMLDDTLLDKRAYLDKCAEVACLDRYNCDESPLPANPCLIKRRVNDYVQSRLECDLMHLHADRSSNICWQRRYQDGRYNGFSSMYP